MRDQFHTVMNMGPLNQVVGMIPGMNANMIPKGQEKESTERIKRFMTMMDSMTKDELDGVSPITEKRVIRICKGSGQKPREFLLLLGEHARFSKMVGRMGKLGLGDNMDNMDAIKKNPQKAMQQLQSAIDPGMLQQMGGMGNVMDMMKGMMAPQEGGGSNPMQDMMKNMMGGAGMPKMPAGMNMESMMA